ncbi:DUF885 domain-containing protein [Allosphingosinicella vermicomposti]|uniref:DUF885 domain-containing protein n=1 Tax=Allosphingosinicella vermicomposti TaxID=614671 RepID=UPI000D0F62D1|nr:DUF885 domain-containing protein [Allosphingosinicella vermicomposti]
MKKTLLALLAASSMLVPAIPAAAQNATPAAAAIQSEGEKLRALFHASDEANLKRNPLSALFRGDMRYADQFGDYLSDAYLKGEADAARADIAALDAIDRAKLNATDQVAYDVFKADTDRTIRSFDPQLVALNIVRPIDHFTGIHVQYPTLASGQSVAPFKTVADYENNLKRHKGYIAYLDAAITRFKQGQKSGVVQSKLTIENVIGQLDTQIAQGVEGSTFYGPVKSFPEGISAADQARLKAEYAATIRDGIIPAYTRLRDYLRNDYLPVAHDGLGLSHMKGGDIVYRSQIEQLTTLPLDPAEVHQLGLREVARIKSEMEAIKTKVGFKGTLKEFFDFIRTDKQFQPASAEALVEGYQAIGKKVDERIRTLFAVLPKTPLEIRPVEPYREKNASGGSYTQGAPDGSRPGIFYFNTYDLPSRSTPGMETLYLHEGAPGHHFQISLAQENEALPAFMRFGGNTAFVEGWALYAETLWKELGMETDPYQRFGGLNDEMLRAMRLVVDTGIHAKGWTRDQSIQYMLDNSAQGRTDATSEVERYAAWPGQALAYKIGQLKFSELRARAEKALGDRFDIREFHEQVLSTGALPMTVLEAKIDRWIASKKG